MVEKIDEAIGHDSVSCKFRNVVDQHEWAFSGVYGLQFHKETSYVGGIGRFDQLVGHSLLCSGDFMWLGSPWIVWGWSTSPLICKIFLSLFPLLGRISYQPLHNGYCLGFYVLSNHFPILLDYGKFSRGRQPFRFENMWLKSNGFVVQVKWWWES